MSIGRFTATAATIVFGLVVGAQGAGAVPPPPPNPSDAELGDSRAAADTRAAEVGRLTNEVAEAEARLMALQSEVEVKLEDANKALVDLAAAEDAAARARADADAAKAAANGAAADLDRAREAIDDFAAGSYRQGSTIGSLSAYLDARSPRDLLDRAQLLNAVADDQLDALDGMEVARTVKANKDSAARAALALAKARQDEAGQAKAAADAAMAAAERARGDQLAQTTEVEARKSQAEQRLTEAQSRVSGLESQRRRYQDWLAAKRREDAAGAAQAMSGGGGGQHVPVAALSVRPPGDGVATVIDRALSQLGVPYAWGGGNADGPTLGVPDGGVADSFGDYATVGFDCSGLMIYAFAGAGISLPHYSGYQYESGAQVPLSEKRPGDMLFWATGGRIHHVALYLGDDRMVEAPYSGSQVRVTSVRYDGIVPYVTRLL